jgi:hypothetical protein
MLYYILPNCTFNKALKEAVMKKLILLALLAVSSIILAQEVPVQKAFSTLNKGTNGKSLIIRFRCKAQITQKEIIELWAKGTSIAGHSNAAKKYLLVENARNAYDVLRFVSKEWGWYPVAHVNLDRDAKRWVVQIFPPGYLGPKIDARFLLICK